MGMSELRVIEAAGLRGRAAFLKFRPQNSQRPDGRRLFSQWRDIHPSRGVLPGRGPYALLMALENDRPVARVMTGADKNFVGQEGRQQGYICLFEAENRPDAVKRLMDEAARRQKQWGSAQVVGPIAPDLVDFCSGVLVKGFDEAPSLLSVHNPSWYDDLLTGCGYQKARDYLAYRFRVSNGLPGRMEQAAQWAKGRSPLVVRECDLGQDERAIQTVLADCGEGVSLQELRRGLGAIRPYYQRPFGFLTLYEGRACGFLLALRMGQSPYLRVSQLFVSPRQQGGSAALLMTEALLSSARRANIQTVEASTIFEKNRASRAVMERLGGINHKIYRQYCLSL